jgi:hypothetical protein
MAGCPMPALVIKATNESHRHPLAGFGAQLNTNLFSAVGQPSGLGDRHLGLLQEATANLRPGHCRVFVEPQIDPTAPLDAQPSYLALVRTLELAQAAGATVNLTWWKGPYDEPARLRALDWPNKNVKNWPRPNRRKWPARLTDPADPGFVSGPSTLMGRFAALLLQVRTRGLTCVTALTIQNEVNGDDKTDIAQQGNEGFSMRLYEWLYRLLDAELKALTDPLTGVPLREVVGLVGGDLVEGEAPHAPQKEWLRYLHGNMEVPRPGLDRVIDGYSVHVYWEPGQFPDRPERRLHQLRDTMQALGSVLPVYVTEFGVRFLAARPRPGMHAGVQLDRSIESAFQHAWFNAVAPQCGCVATVKWVLYRTDVAAGWGEWGMLDAPANEFERFPLYRATRLLTHAVPAGWVATGLGRAADDALLASRFEAPDGGHQSIVVLNRGSDLHEVRLDGLLPGRLFLASGWNLDRSGQLAPAPAVASDGHGDGTVTVPAGAMVALSTLPLGL